MAFLKAQLSGYRHACRYIVHRCFPRGSHADHQEDRVVCALLGRVRTFMDVGANDGLSSSNTALMAFRGARGICFEPNPDVFLRLKSFYQWTKRVECVPEGLSEKRGSLPLRCDGLLSAMPVTEDGNLVRLLAKFRQENECLVEVPVSRLSDWLSKRPDFIGCDLISIDVEGHELNVLRGVDWSIHPKPCRAFIIETHAMHEGQDVWRHRDYGAIAELLVAHGFHKISASRNNTIWLHEADLNKELTAKAKAVAPDFTWFVS